MRLSRTSGTAENTHARTPELVDIDAQTITNNTVTTLPAGSFGRCRRRAAAAVVDHNVPVRSPRRRRSHLPTKSNEKIIIIKNP